MTTVRARITNALFMPAAGQALLTINTTGYQLVCYLAMGAIMGADGDRISIAYRTIKKRIGRSSHCDFL